MYDRLCARYDQYYSGHQTLNLVVALISSLSLMAVGMFLFTHPKFKGKHPYSLILTATLFEASLYLMTTYKNYTCGLHWPWFLSVTSGLPSLATGSTLGDIASFERQYSSLKILQSLQKFSYSYSLNMNLLTNSIFFVDLYLTIKNPFVPRQSRYKGYYALALIMTIWQISDYIYFNP